MDKNQSRVLMVEDDSMIAEIYRKKAESAGIIFEIVDGGKKAISALRTGIKYDLVLLDMVLPEMTGPDILTAIRDDGRIEPKPRIIVFSNLSGEEDKKKAYELGAEGYIAKSQFTPSELVEEVKRLIHYGKERVRNEELHDARTNGKTLPAEGKSILFMEDNKVFAELFGKKLENDGFSVTYTDNGAWGILEAKKKNFDLVIIDMVMPAMRGDEVVQVLKSDPKTADIPIVVISASATDAEMRAVREMGIADYFIKTSATPGIVAARVRDILGI